MKLDPGLGDPAVGIRDFKRQCADTGRDPDTIPITVFVAGQPPMSQLEAYKEAGAVRIVLGTGHPTLHREDRALTFLDRYADTVTHLA